MATVEGTQTRGDGGRLYDGFISYSHAADDLLAPRLQSALQRFAKPWWKRRAVRIFRDESSLSANPHLWSSITEALDTSGWFVLLLSPDAARSEWVNQEITYWVDNRDPKKILPVVTDGTFDWQGTDVAGDAVPDALRGVFEEEPRWVDVRWAKDEDQLDLQDPRFADAVADIASTIRGIPKDDLASEEVRQHRRTVRTAWAAGGLVTVLAIAAVGFGIQSARNADEAERQAAVAEANRAEAEANRIEAEANAEQARQAADAEATARAASDRDAAIARAREMAANAVDAARTDSQLALLLATSAIELLPEDELIGPALQNGLRTAMASDRLIDSYAELSVPGLSSLDVSPDGSRVAVSVLPSRTLEVLDAQSLEPIWTYAADIQDGFEWVAFSSEGSYVLLSVPDARYTQIGGFVEGEPEGEPDARILVFDADTGDLVRTEVVPGACAVNVFPGGWREDLELFGFGYVGCGDAEFDGTVRFVDTASWETVHEHPASDFAHATFADDGTLVAVFSGFNSEFDSAILDASTWEVIREVDYPWGDMSPDGTLLAGASFEGVIGVIVEDAMTGELVDRFVLDTFPWSPRFSADGSLLAVSDFGDITHVFDPRSGAKEAEIITGPSDSTALRGSELLTMWEGTVSKWDALGGSLGEINTVPLNLWVNANSFFTADGTYLAHVSSITEGEWWLYPFDPMTGDLAEPIPATNMWQITPIQGNRVVLMRGREIAPDGRILGPGDEWDFDPSEVTVERGPLEVLDVETGEATVVAGCWMEESAAMTHQPCPDGTPHPAGEFFEMATRDGSEFMIFDRFDPDDDTQEIYVSIWDSETLTVTDRINLGVIEGLGNQLARSVLTDDYLVLYQRRTQELRIIDRATGEEVPFDQGDAEPQRLEHDRARNRIWFANNGNTVRVLDLDDLTIRQVTEPAAGQVRALATSPTGDRIAVGSTEGHLRIWTEGGELITEIPLVNPSDAWWIDDDHLVVGTANGPWTVVTLDARELAEIARGRIVRGFTPAECDLYAIDPCPTLDEMRSR
jgi:WD40 repeat protein